VLPFYREIFACEIFFMEENDLTTLTNLTFSVLLILGQRFASSAIFPSGQNPWRISHEWSELSDQVKPLPEFVASSVTRPDCRFELSQSGERSRSRGLKT